MSGRYEGAMADKTDLVLECDELLCGSSKDDKYLLQELCKASNLYVWCLKENIVDIWRTDRSLVISVCGLHLSDRNIVKDLMLMLGFK